MAAGVGIFAGLLTAVIVIRRVANLPAGYAYPTGFTLPRSYAFKYEEVRLEAEDGTSLSAWFVPAPQSTRVLLVLHGSAVNLGYLGHGLLESLTRLGVNVLALDYRGYGKSGGKADVDGVCMDAEAAWRYLTNQRKFRPSDVFIHGQSLGGAVAIDLASRRRCGGVIAESTFTSFREAVRLDLDIPLLEYALKPRLNSIETIRNVGAPVLVVHGTKDSTIPFEMGKRLFAAAPGPKAFYAVENADHDNPFIEGGQAYRDRLLRFILTGS